MKDVFEKYGIVMLSYVYKKNYSSIWNRVTIINLSSIMNDQLIFFKKTTDLNWWNFLAIQQQKIIIPNKYGNKLVGKLHEAGTKEIVILCHGLRASKVSFSDIIDYELNISMSSDPIHR